MADHYERAELDTRCVHLSPLSVSHICSTLILRILCRLYTQYRSTLPSSLRLTQSGSLLYTSVKVHTEVTQVDKGCRH